MSSELENSTEVPGDDNLIIKATSDLFIASLLSAPSHEPTLLDLINAVLEHAGEALAKRRRCLTPSM